MVVFCNRMMTCISGASCVSACVDTLSTGGLYQSAVHGVNKHDKKRLSLCYELRPKYVFSGDFNLIRSLFAGLGLITMAPK